MTGPQSDDGPTRSAGRALVCSTDSDGDAGVYGYAFDDERGTLRELDATGFERPMYLAVSSDGRHAYVANRAGEGRVDCVAVDRERGAVAVRDERSSGGAGPCHVSLDSDDRFAFVANYDGGVVAMLPVDSDGRLGDPCDVVAHEGSSVDPDRQVTPHPHAAVPGPDDRLLYVPDLGTDRVEAYEIAEDGDEAGDARNGTLRHRDGASADLPPGTGPRHLAFGPGGEYGYLVGELDATVTALSRDPDTGALDPVGRAPTVPSSSAAETAPADVAVHPSGEWLYVSNRGHQSVVTVDIDTGDPGPGRLEPRGYTPTGGENPRDIALAPDGQHLLVENRDSYEIVTFAVAADGSLSAVTRTPASKPTCLAFVPDPAE